MHINNEVIAALITTVGSILVALIRLLPGRIEKRIQGLLNGKRNQALEEIDRLYRERKDREARGLPVRRQIDRDVEELHGDHA